MTGGGRKSWNVPPAGKAVPCHAAESLPGLVFPSIRDSSLADIWYRSDAFNRYRGTDWMAEPCRSCDRREIDWGGCRFPALLLARAARRADSGWEPKSTPLNSSPTWISYALFCLIKKKIMTPKRK